jgi:hypothetical protein
MRFYWRWNTFLLFQIKWETKDTTLSEQFLNSIEIVEGDNIDTTLSEQFLNSIEIVEGDKIDTTNI